MTDVNNTEKTIAAIRKRIEQYSELANDLIYEYLQAGEPIPRIIQKQYNELGTLTEGLQEAINIIMLERA